MHAARLCEACPNGSGCEPEHLVDVALVLFELKHEQWIARMGEQRVDDLAVLHRPCGVRGRHTLRHVCVALQGRVVCVGDRLGPGTSRCGFGIARDPSGSEDPGHH